MLRCSPLLLALALGGACLGACRVTGAEPPDEPARSPEQVPRARTFDVEHYGLELALDPGARALEGRCRLRLWSLDAPLAEVALDLVDLSVERVLDARGAPLGWRHEEGVLAIALDPPAPPRSLVEFSVDYTGTPTGGLRFVGGDGATPTHVFSQGFAQDSRYWFPCWDAPGDRATSELRVTMPPGWTSVAAGERIDVSETPDAVTHHWRMTTPHPVYLTTLVAGDLVVREGDWDGVPLLYLAEPAYADWMDASFAQTARALGVLSDIAGVRYPYRKYAQACVEDLPYGGMENISASTLTNRTLGDERKNRDAPSTSLVVHEAAHQWYGDLITPADWSHAWLSEGLATYATLLYFEKTGGYEAFQPRLRDAQDAHARHARGAARQPVVSSRYGRPEDLFDADIYAGAAVRLHLLRSWIGDAAFFAGLKEYTRANANGLVTTGDLRSAMEAASGLDLSTFFEQWFHSPGYPELRTSWTWDGDSGRVRLTVVQEQDPSDGTPRAFRFPVEVEIHDAARSFTHRIEVSAWRQTFDLPSLREPIWVRFDEHSAVPKTHVTDKSAAEWMAIATSSLDVNGRRDAVRALGTLVGELEAAEHAEVVQVLAARLAGDRSPWVRAGAARALGGVEGPIALRALRDAGAGDPESRARVAALEALAATGPDTDLASYARERFDEAWSWDTMAAAARLLAAAAPAEAADFLRAALHEHESPFGRLESRLRQILDDLGADPVRAAPVPEATP